MSRDIGSMRCNSLAWAPTFVIASMLTCTRWRGRQESIESFTRTIIVRWLRGSLLRCIIPSQNKQRLYARSWIAAGSQRGSENICDKFVSALPEPTGWQLASAYLHIGAPIPGIDGS